MPPCLEMEQHCTHFISHGFWCAQSSPSQSHTGQRYRAARGTELQHGILGLSYKALWETYIKHTGWKGIKWKKKKCVLFSMANTLIHTKENCQRTSIQSPIWQLMTTSTSSNYSLTDTEFQPFSKPYLLNTRCLEPLEKHYCNKGQAFLHSCKRNLVREQIEISPFFTHCMP